MRWLNRVALASAFLTNANQSVTDFATKIAPLPNGFGTAYLPPAFKVIPLPFQRCISRAKVIMINWWMKDQYGFGEWDTHSFAWLEFDCFCYYVAFNYVLLIISIIVSMDNWSRVRYRNIDAVYSLFFFSIFRRCGCALLIYPFQSNQ